MPELVEQALRNGGPRCDNVTVLALEWDGVGEADAGEDCASVSTQALEDRGFASTIQGRDGVGGTDRRFEMDEAEIDRSVREIKEAIRLGNERSRANEGAGKKKS